MSIHSPEKARLRPNEIELIRVYNAPVKVVWDAWTDMSQVEQWWGPRGFSITTSSKDLQPGGQWIYTMRGPDGTVFPNITTYRVVLKYEKLVYDHGGNDDRKKLLSMAVTFKEHKGKTTLRIISTLPTSEDAQTTKRLIKNANGDSTWDRLGEFLENKINGNSVFMITRSFEMNIKSMFELWVNPDHFSRWLGPADSTMRFLNTDVKEDSSSMWSMTSEGQTKYGKLTYLKIGAPDVLIYIQNFCDNAGKLCKPPFAPSYPDMLLTTVQFAEEAPNQTRVTVTWEIKGEATAAERKTFHDMKPLMTESWSASFDKIDALLNLQSPSEKNS